MPVPRPDVTQRRPGSLTSPPVCVRTGVRALAAVSACIHARSRHSGRCLLPVRVYLHPCPCGWQPSCVGRGPTSPNVLTEAAHASLSTRPVGNGTIRLLDPSRLPCCDTLVALVLKLTCEGAPRDSHVERGVCSAALLAWKQAGGASGPSHVAPAGEAHWHCLLRARAIETQSYVLAAAQVGCPIWRMRLCRTRPRPHPCMHGLLEHAQCISLSLHSHVCDPSAASWPRPDLPPVAPAALPRPAPRPPAPTLRQGGEPAGRAGCKRPAARRRSAGTTRDARATGMRWRWTRGAQWWARLPSRRRASASCGWTARGCATCARPCPWPRTADRAAPAWAGARRAASR